MVPRLPLLFSFHQVVVGNGFVAGVRMRGRALLEVERIDGHEEQWITGIAPVGIAGGGSDRSVACTEFRRAWLEVLFDLAATAGSLDEFRELCGPFLSSQQASLTTLWDEAVASIRREHYVDPSLQSADADVEVAYEVVDLSHLDADANEVETGLQIAA
ncbi:MAG: hypothetical protein H6828_14280 [Planctomycetes bacterium]|nr:hypothetical protein [Planctomycetota bacterium]